MTRTATGRAVIPRGARALLPVGALACALVACACGDDTPPSADGSVGIDCDREPVVPRYADVVLFRDVCVQCHASTRVGAERHDAPEGVDFDSYDAAVRNAEAASRMVRLEAMPPPLTDVVEPPSAEARHELRVWAECGTPE